MSTNRIDTDVHHAGAVSIWLEDTNDEVARTGSAPIYPLRAGDVLMRSPQRLRTLPWRKACWPRAERSQMCRLFFQCRRFALRRFGRCSRVLLGDSGRRLVS